MVDMAHGVGISLWLTDLLMCLFQKTMCLLRLRLVHREFQVFHVNDFPRAKMRLRT